MRWVSHLLGRLAISALSMRSIAAHAESAQIDRGKYLVQLGGCTHCHTPGHLLGKPDLSRYLGGSDLGFEVAGVGTFVGPNLTPDEETGLGTWTKAQIIAAIRTGERPDGRVLVPIMPWRDFAALSGSDVSAIVDYVKSLPSVRYKVPGPFGPDEKPAISRMTIAPPSNASHTEHAQ
jgi:mono/diheme cytochrome c family protein